MMCAGLFPPRASIRFYHVKDPHHLSVFEPRDITWAQFDDWRAVSYSHLSSHLHHLPFPSRCCHRMPSLVSTVLKQIALPCTHLLFTAKSDCHVNHKIFIVPVSMPVCLPVTTGPLPCCICPRGAKAIQVSRQTLGCRD